MHHNKYSLNGSSVAPCSLSRENVCKHVRPAVHRSAVSVFVPRVSGCDEGVFSQASPVPQPRRALKRGH